MTMNEGEEKYPLPRLLQLVSPALPTGAFSYSQGLEWAVDAGWITDSATLARWLRESLDSPLCRVDLPILKRLYDAFFDRDNDRLQHWIDLLLACRESRELRTEEMDRGRAMRSLLAGLGLLPQWLDETVIARSQLAGFALFAARSEIALEAAATGYLWSWLENQVMAGVKIIPLGQTEGQRLLLELAGVIEPAVNRGLTLADDEIGASSPGLALASCFHETQYTRIYRS